MKYFIPNWEDRLDPKFDFVNDSFSSERTTPVKYDVYAHNIFTQKTYDGILMSMNIFGDKVQVNGTTEIKNYAGKTIRDYLKLRSNGNKYIKTMCDCGAFSYINEETPPEKYTPKYISEVYSNLNFDYGVSVDHMMNKNLSKDKNEERRKLSIKNAKLFIKHYNKNNYSFIPLGAAQGYDIPSYRKSVQKLIEYGYTHIGLGTLIPQPDKFILELLNNLQDLIIKSKIKIHLFGILRKDCISEFQKLKVDSFDSASYLRKAWLRSDNNYLGKDLNWYSAIRVPIIDVTKLKEKGYSDLEIIKFKFQEKDILRLLNEYDKGKEKVLDELLENVNDYDQSLVRAFEDTKKYAEKYRNVLESKIWKKCNCAMCKQAGIHIIVFRRTNRNKRRGFHNTWVFYNNYLK
jgi:hypothetical protein